MDRRLLAVNERVADIALEGALEADQFVKGTARQLTVPFADLLRAPRGQRDRQLQMGDDVAVFEDRNGFSFVKSEKDGYCGYVPSEQLGEPETITHFVSSRATHLYQAEDFKSPETAALSFGARLRVIDERRKFYEISNGSFVPKKHLRAIDRPFSDPVTIAQLHFGTPYLWGGNSSFGIDCSGLIQSGLIACDTGCPGDSDLQEIALGYDVTGGGYRRGDILFWVGHVAMVVDADTLIHANAHHMAVAYEPIRNAILRIKTQGDGPVTSHKRLD